MAAKQKDGDVVSVVDEDAGTISVGVVHGGKTLIVAQKNLDYAAASAPDGDATTTDDDAGKEG